MPYTCPILLEPRLQTNYTELFIATTGRFGHAEFMVPTRWGKHTARETMAILRAVFTSRLISRFGDVP